METKSKGDRLKGRVAIVTGGGLGIGHAYSIGFAQAGARVVVADIAFDAAQTTAALLEGMGAEALAVKVDISSVEQTLEMARKTVERFGRIDILMNNGGLSSVITRGVAFDELSLDEWRRTMDVNISGTFYCCRAVSPYMKRQRFGRIINISSGQVYEGGGRIKYVHYVTSKAAILGMTRALARELGEFNVNVNCMCPATGGIWSGISTEAAEARRKKIIDAQCIPRLGIPEDMVGTAVYLASSDSDFVTGQTIIVDGGHRML